MAPKIPCLLVVTNCVVTFHIASGLDSAAKKIQK